MRVTAKCNTFSSASAYTAQPGVNLLRNSSAEDNGSWWSAVSTSTAVAYSGSRSFILNNNAFYQIVTLSAGNTYTFSAYVNMPTAGGVVQLALLDTSGNILAASTPLTTSTLGPTRCRSVGTMSLQASCSAMCATSTCSMRPTR